MKYKIIQLLTLSIIIFVIGIFFISLNKSSLYDTKNLEGQVLKDIKLDHFSENRLATAGADNDVKLWSIKNIDQDYNLEFLAPLSYHSKAVNAVRFSPNGDMVASASTG